MRRIASRRAGVSRDLRERLKNAHRACVMLRHGAYLFDDEGREQWRGNCLRCGKVNWLQVSHIEPKGQFPHLEFDVDNAFALCYRCHLHWWHKNPREADAFSVAQMGESARERLAMRARARHGRIDAAAVLLFLTQMRATMGRGG